MTNFLPAAQAQLSELVDTRRDLHRNPELGFQEVRTSALVADRLEALGLDVRRGVGITGVVAEIRNGAGPTVLLRADMDALPILEDADHDYASEFDGVMHACGHDGHTSSLLTAARMLVQARDDGSLPAGTIRLVFQPCEETVDAEGMSGAMRMIDDGILDGVDAALAMHLGAHLESGVFLVGPGPVMAAATEVKVTVSGRSAHAALPHEGVDALVLTAQGISAVQTAVSRRIAPTEAGVITFGTIHGGTAGNVIPDRVRLEGTIRSLDPQVQSRLISTLEAAFAGLEPQGAWVEVEYGTPFPAVLNNPEMAEVIFNSFTHEFGAQHVRPQPGFLTAEDFGFISEAVPSVFFWLGAALSDPRSHHHPRFDFDESVLPMGAAAMARGGAALLAHLGR